MKAAGPGKGAAMKADSAKAAAPVKGAAMKANGPYGAKAVAPAKGAGDKARMSHERSHDGDEGKCSSPSQGQSHDGDEGKGSSPSQGHSHEGDGYWSDWHAGSRSWSEGDEGHVHWHQHLHHHHHHHHHHSTFRRALRELEVDAEERAEDELNPDYDEDLADSILVHGHEISYRRPER